MIKAPPPLPASRDGWPVEAGRAVEWVDWWGSFLVQSMRECAIAYPRHMYHVASSGGRARDDVVATVPSHDKPHPFMHQAYAGFMELRVPTTLPAQSKERVMKALLAEGTELRSHAHGMRTSDPSTRKEYPAPRAVSVWLLMHRRVASGPSTAGTCPSDVDYLDGFAHLFASHEVGGEPLQRHVRGAVACGDDALEVLRSHSAGGFEGAALLVVTHANETAPGARSESGPFCVLYQLNSNRVTLASVARRGAPPAVTWQDADDRPVRRFANVAELFQTVLTEVAKVQGVSMPSVLFNPLAPMAADAFRQHTAEASREFNAMLDADPVVRRAALMPDDVPLCVTGVMMRITPWRSLHDATQRQFADTAHNAHLDEHTRRHITSMARFERDAFPAMLLCAKGSEAVARNYAAEFWSLRPLRGASEENAWVHVAQLRVRPLSVHSDVSAYGLCGVAGEPVGEGVLGQRQLTLTPLADVDIATQFCVQPCSLTTLVPRGDSRDVLRAYTSAMKVLANFVDRECVAAYPDLLGAPSAQTGSASVGTLLASFGAPLAGAHGRARYKRPHGDIHGATTGRMLLPFDLLSTRTTVGEACAFVGVTGDHVAPGVRALVFAMLNHCGASTSLGEALTAHSRLSEAYMESGADAEEIGRLRSIALAAQRMGSLGGGA